MQAYLGCNLLFIGLTRGVNEERQKWPNSSLVYANWKRTFFNWEEESSFTIQTDVTRKKFYD